MVSPTKKYPTLACCGLDCGLCPRYNMKGASKCPGCQGPDFALKHPSCGILTCCFKNQGLECCGECPQYPCEKIKPWASGDSFISHQVCLKNLDRIKLEGIESFILNQQKRIKILERLLDQFDDGKSKNMFCLAATLLPPEKIAEFIQNAVSSASEKSEQSKIIKNLMQDYAKITKIELKLRK